MIEFRNIYKIFGTNKALSEVSLTIKKNEVHSIVGENGAGKSTLLKILCGIHQPTSGQILIDDTIFSPSTPQEAFQKKIVMIHQHFMLGGQLTAFENILLSQTSHQWPASKLNKKTLRHQIDIQIKKLNWTLKLDEPVEKLSVGDQQRIEILKALLTNPKILILDEPTAVLTPLETEDLLKFIVELKKQGLTIILVTHKLNEVMKVSDQISVLRRGQFIKTFQKLETTVDEISESMIGHELHKTKTEYSEFKEIICSISLKTNTPNSISLLDLRKGEIFGIAGVEGNGQSNIILSVLSTLKKAKISFGDITEDRLHLGCFPDLNLVEHVLLKGPLKKNSMGWLQKDAAFALTEKIINEWDVRPGDPLQKMGTLSGGNQQKFVVGLELSKQPQFLIAAHPTRGVDLGAVNFIHERIKQFAKKGGTVFLVSSELDEILSLSHRYGILFSNSLNGPFNVDQLNENQIGSLMTLGKLNHELKN